MKGPTVWVAVYFQVNGGPSKIVRQVSATLTKGQKVVLTQKDTSALQGPLPARYASYVYYKDLPSGAYTFRARLTLNKRTREVQTSFTVQR